MVLGVGKQQSEPSVNDYAMSQFDSLESESSFVVLNHRSLSDESLASQLPTNSVMNSQRYGNEMAGAAAINTMEASVQSSVGSDLNLEYLQNHLKNLMTENVNLKDTLEQNNLAMREQLTLISIWREETEIQNLDLQKSNKFLTSELDATREQLKSFSMSVMSRSGANHSSFKKSLERDSTLEQLKSMSMISVSGSAEKNESLKRKSCSLTSRDMEDTMKDRIKSLVLERDDLLKELDEVKELVKGTSYKEETKKVKLLEEETLKNNEKYEALCRDNMTLRNQMCYVQTQKNELEIEKKASNEEKEELEGKLNALVQRVSELEDQNEEREAKEKVARNDLLEKWDQLCILRECMEQHKGRYVALNDRTSTLNNLSQIALRQYSTQEEQVVYQTELERFQNFLQHDCERNSHDRNRLIHVHKELDALLDRCSTMCYHDYRNTEKVEKDNQWEEFHARQMQELQEKLCNADDELQQCHQLLSQRDRQWECAQQQLNEKNRELALLTENMRQATSDSEDVEVLRAQVEVYRTDFLAEREAREQAVGKMEELRDVIQRLEDGHPAMHNQRILQHDVRQPPAANPTRYTCPICTISFRSLQSLQIHTQNCGT